VSVAATSTTPTQAWRTGGRGGRQRLIPDPATGELVPYQRVSTFAKTLDDKEGLIAWKAWMALRGAQVEQGLLQQALHADTTPRGVVDALAEAGGAGQKRDRGADRHQIVAMALSGAPLPQMPSEARAELDAVLRLIESLGTVVGLEVPTVCDRWQVCGSVDLVLTGSDGTTVVADLKTGAKVDRLAHSIQLISYARSWVWDFDAERRTGPVAASRPRLVVLHAPQGGAEPALVDLDVDRATRWADLARDVRQARREAARKETT
jgi:hypothetical protein